MPYIACVERCDPERIPCRWAKNYKCLIGMKVDFFAKLFYCKHYQPEHRIEIPRFVDTFVGWLLLRLAWQEERETLFYRVIDKLRFVVMLAAIFYDVKSLKSVVKRWLKKKLERRSRT